MDNKLYLIHEDDYLRHIDHKLEMYDLLLELVDTLREDLAEGETARAVRNLCSYEQDAHILFECWTIPDAYVESCGDPAYLSRLMERELTPAEDDDEDDDGDVSAAVRLLRAANQLTGSTRAILDVANEIVEFEEEVDRLLSENEKPENDCGE